MKKINKSFHKFWLSKSKLISWNIFPTKSLILKKKNYFTWFEDGKFNITYNCIERNIKNNGDKTALIFISKCGDIKKISYIELRNAVDNFCFFLKKKNIDKIKNVLIHSSASLESAVAMLAFAKLGIFFSVIFEELEFKAIKLRYEILKPDLVVTKSDELTIKKKLYFSKKYKSKILKFNGTRKHKDIIYYKLDYKFNKNYPYINFNGNKKMFCLFTSGSTGIPKGVVHSAAGYFLYSMITCKYKFGINSNTTIIAASDAGWINGHTYSLFGPLGLGASSIILETPTLILSKKILDIIVYDLAATIIYLPVTLIRIMKSLSPNIKYVKNSLNCIGSMGEPLAPTVASWFRKVFGKNLNIINTYFQTETSGIIYSTSYKDKISNYENGSCGTPVNRFIKLKNNRDNKKKFELKLRYIWPGCMTNIINSDAEYQKYWDEKGNFKLFDFGSFSKKNNLFVHGRIDDVLNIRGHRIGSAEVESVVLKIKNIKEASVVSIKDKIEYEKIILYLSLNPKVKLINILKLINKKINDNFGNFAQPKHIIILDELPKTRSGKILRRLLRNIYDDPNQKIGDISTMINKKSIKNIINQVKKIKKL